MSGPGEWAKVLVDEVLVASQELKSNKPGKFFEVEYSVPEALTKGKSSIRVKFVAAQPLYGGPLFSA